MTTITSGGSWRNQAITLTTRPVSRNGQLEVNPDALVFGTDTGTPLDRHNLVNRQLKPTCKKLGLTGVSWHWLRHANATLLDAVGTPLACLIHQT